LVGTLRRQGVPATVSGAGPSVLALTTPATATIAAEAVAGQGWRVERTPLDTRGARAVSIRGGSGPN
ncbi:MAG: homoserine kinase, partial [Actinomycetes bacterium]